MGDCDEGKRETQESKLERKAAGESEWVVDDSSREREKRDGLDAAVLFKGAKGRSCKKQDWWKRCPTPQSQSDPGQGVLDKGRPP